MNWKSKHQDKLPDFIIGGAMKSGTTSLHAILNAHPDIKIAHNELGFFDIDSILQHPDFSFFNNKDNSWTSQSMKENTELLWNWYYSQFDKSLEKEDVIGEDSTTYLCSESAAKRIALQDKPIKLIFILRHPTKRTISNYLHLLKSGRAIHSLEDTLRYNPNSIIRRSLYKEQLEKYYKHIPFNRIKVVLFEDLISNTKETIKEVCEFVNVDYSLISEDAFLTHSNKTKTPKSIYLQLLRNRLLRYYADYRYSKFLPIQPNTQAKIPFSHKIINKIHKKINPQKTDIKFNPSSATNNYLDDFFKKELEGIDELTKLNIYSKWFNN